MSLSKERYEYHLTPNGWVEGSFFGDALGGKVIRETPTDRLMTLLVFDEFTSPGKPSVVYDRVNWKSEDQVALDKLLAKYGTRPSDALPLS